ncbi:acyl-CoA dehydrogenase family protein [Streptomyces sp. VRA16 Mangrove soil]|nr:acyl-CoA dehydrogenase family protein [Streptomyces sp. VRA16 Mangrove soil]
MTTDQYCEWEAQGHPPRDFYRKLGELGTARPA